MKTLVYTVSDFSKSALGCIEYLHRSLKHKNDNFDFSIVTNQPIKNSTFDLIYDDNNSPYVGFLKYSKNIPTGYDRYVYLDSDILFFESLDNAFSPHANSFVREDCSMENEWFNSAFDNKDELHKYKAINAGSFSFSSIDFLDGIRKIFKSKITNDALSDAKLEQSSLNRFLVENKILESPYNDFSNLVQLHVNPYHNYPGKTIYHFCGYSGGMTDKYDKMTTFLRKGN
jgi:hypothetical protein